MAQKSRDKIAQYEEIKYDLMFVGDDWKGSEIFTELEKYPTTLEPKSFTYHIPPRCHLQSSRQF